MNDTESITALDGPDDRGASLFENAAQRVIDKLGQKEPTRALDPTMIVGIITMIMDLIKQCRESRSAGQIERLSKSNRPFVNAVARRVVRRQMIDDAIVEGFGRREGIRRFRAYGRSIAESMMESARESADGEVAALVVNLP